MQTLFRTQRRDRRSCQPLRLTGLPALCGLGRERQGEAEAGELAHPGGRFAPLVRLTGVRGKRQGVENHVISECR